MPHSGPFTNEKHSLIGNGHLLYLWLLIEKHLLKAGVSDGENMRIIARPSRAHVRQTMLQNITQYVVMGVVNTCGEGDFPRFLHV